MLWTNLSKKARGHFWTIVCFIVILFNVLAFTPVALTSSSEDGTGTTRPSRVFMSRKDAEDRIKHAFSISPTLRSNISADAAQSLVGRINQEIVEEGDKILPEKLDGVSPENTGDVIDDPVVLDFADERYCELLVKEKVFQVKMALLYRQMVGDIDEVTSNNISNNIDRYLTGIQASMIAHLVTDGHVMNQSTVNASVEGMRRQFTREKNLTDCFYFKKAIPSGEIDRLIHEFDERLGLSMGRAQVLISEAQKQAEESHSAASIESAQDKILSEIIIPTSKALEKKTVDKSRDINPPDDAIVTYKRLENELNGVESGLKKNRKNTVDSSPTTAPIH